MFIRSLRTQAKQHENKTPVKNSVIWKKSFWSNQKTINNGLKIKNFNHVIFNISQCEWLRSLKNNLFNGGYKKINPLADP